MTEPRLKALLTLPENKKCADCWALQPRYASITHGVFLCNRCFGVHRGMGVHVSRTRSVQLDKWNDEQISAMERGGNAAHARTWETGLPNGARPPPDADDAQRETFIRAKYERRRWAAASQATERQLTAPAPAAAPRWGAPAGVPGSHAPGGGAGAGGRAGGHEASGDLIDLGDPPEPPQEAPRTWQRPSAQGAAAGPGATPRGALPAAAAHAPSAPSLLDDLFGPAPASAPAPAAPAAPIPASAPATAAAAAEAAAGLRLGAAGGGGRGAATDPFEGLLQWR